MTFLRGAKKWANDEKNYEFLNWQFKAFHKTMEITCRNNARLKTS